MKDTPTASLPVCATVLKPLNFIEAILADACSPVDAENIYNMMPLLNPPPPPLYRLRACFQPPSVFNEAK